MFFFFLICHFFSFVSLLVCLFILFFIFYLLLDALCFFSILSFLFQTLFNCNASLICCFSYCLFWCSYFLVGFCKWFVTIFITSHGSIAILLTSFVLLSWMTHKCLAQLGMLPFSLSYFNLSLIQKSTFIFWTLMVNLQIPQKRLIHIYALQFLQPLFCVSIVCQ